MGDLSDELAELENELNNNPEVMVNKNTAVNKAYYEKKVV